MSNCHLETMHTSLYKLLRVIALFPLQMTCSFGLLALNILSGAELLDHLRYLILRLLGVRGKGRFTILSPIEITPYCAFRRIRIDGPGFINRGLRMGVPEGGTVTIEKNVSIGPRVQFECTNHGLKMQDGRRPGTCAGRIHVEQEVWIGAASIILAGVTLGKGSVVAAGSVVTRDVEPYSLVAGVPARFKKSLR